LNSSAAQAWTDIVQTKTQSISHKSPNLAAGVKHNHVHHFPPLQIASGATSQGKTIWDQSLKESSAGGLGSFLNMHANTSEKKSAEEGADKKKLVKVEADAVLGTTRTKEEPRRGCKDGPPLFYYLTKLTGW